MSHQEPTASVALDKTYSWHPFTPLDEWLDPNHHPVMIASAQGSWLVDEEGKTYLDGNSSIWTNTHGHCHQRMIDSLHEQLKIPDHCSYLGLGHSLGSTLAQRLSQLTTLQRTLFSSDGSSAMEAALKIATQYFQQNGSPERKLFVSLSGAYHGDTVGNMSLSGPSFNNSSFRLNQFLCQGVIVALLIRPLLKKPMPVPPENVNGNAFQRQRRCSFNLEPKWSLWWLNLVSKGLRGW
jgi:adenosylmethionine-8-amino-7-oxononanoate aminotransferase